MTSSSGSVRPRDPSMLLAHRARDAGLEIVETSGFFQVIPPELGFDVHASTIAAAKSRAIQSGVASGDEIDALERALRAAKDGGYDWVTTPFFLALTLRTQPAEGRLPSRRGLRGLTASAVGSMAASPAAPRRCPHGRGAAAGHNDALPSCVECFCTCASRR